jgi:hypothetical protein
MKIVKIVLSVLFILGGIGIAAQGSVVSGITSLTLGVLLLPQIAEKLKESVNAWKKKGIRYATYIILLIICGVTNTQSLESSTSGFIANQNSKVKKSKFQTYIDVTNSNIQNLTAERKKLREDMIAELQKTETYKNLVENKIVSAEYLPVITTINNGVRSILIDNNGNESVAFNPDVMEVLKRYENFKDKQNFAIKSAILATSNKGGFSEELLEVFMRYRNKYNVYGGSKKSFDMDGNLTEEILPYNMSAIFYHIQPNEQDFQAIYDANGQGISEWLGTVNNLSYKNKYFASKQDYLAYAKKHYPNSPYIMKVDIEISANSLYGAYEQNEVAADEKYKNKKLGVTGIIGDIGKDVFDEPYVSLKISYLQNINCYFDDKNNKLISKLRKGQRITVIGNCEGKSITNVILKDCEIWNE